MCNKNIREEICYDIVLASYNGEKYIKEQIESIISASQFCQIAKLNKLIISDDYSSDDTYSIINTIKKEFPSIELHKNICKTIDNLIKKK